MAGKSNSGLRILDISETDVWRSSDNTFSQVFAVLSGEMSATCMGNGKPPKARESCPSGCGPLGGGRRGLSIYTCMRMFIRIYLHLHSQAMVYVDI